jgi:heavy metal translocating P-type ATPase
LTDIVIVIFCSLNALYRLYKVIISIAKGDWGTDILAILAISSTLFVDEYLASFVVVMMTWTGEFIEHYAANRAKKNLQVLRKLRPTKAHLKNNTKIIDVSISDIKPDDIILIKAGEITVTEGVIVKGVAIFDESSITGEMAPIRKGVNDKILSGTKNGNTAFYMRVLVSPQYSEYQKIIDLVEKAMLNKPQIISLASRYSIYFTGLALILAAGAYFLTHDLDSIARVLVLATPCPLLIAAPVAFLGGINAGAKRGIIFKNSNSIQILSEVKTVAFDKTGTITLGHPKLVRVKLLQDVEMDKVLYLAFSLEKYSSHPLSKAFQNYFEKLGQANKKAKDVYNLSAQVKNISEMSGLGIQGVVDNIPISIVKGEGEQISSDFYIRHNKVARFIFEDSVKPDAAKTITNLKRHNVQKLALLTGDNYNTANKIAKLVGIDRAYADLKPLDKVEVMNQLEPRPVLFVGDGINDAPVLATADLGLAISHGNLSAASQSADIVIGGDHLCDIPKAMKIASRTMIIAKQSMIGGIALSVIAMVFAGLGFIPAIYGALGQEIIDVVAIVNGLRASLGVKKS